METFTVNDKTFEIKNTLTFGQMKRINKAFGTALGSDEIPDLTTLADSEILKLKPKIENMIKLNDSQLELIADVIKHSLGYSDEELENIPYSQANEIFNKIVENSQPKKKPQGQYA